MDSTPRSQANDDEVFDHDCVAAILRDGDRLLLCHRHPARGWMPDVWDLPGGHVEPLEDGVGALVRELDEELGVVIDPDDAVIFDVLVDEDASVRLHVWLIDYSGPVENREPSEHDALRWVRRADLSGLPLADPNYDELFAKALAPIPRLLRPGGDDD